MRTPATDLREVSEWSSALASTRASQSKWKELHKPGAPLPTPPVITDCRIFVARARSLQQRLYAGLQVCLPYLLLPNAPTSDGQLTVTLLTVS